jgi:hypothetical protein
MSGDWIPIDTSTHQDHVIAHILGATVLAFFEFDEAMHLLLDMGFIWTIYLDGEMGLLPHGLLVSELDMGRDEKQELLADIELLQRQEGAVTQLSRMIRPPVECLINEVTFFAEEDRRRLLLLGEDGSLAIETSLTTAEIKIYEYS